ncbi:rho guanine nucleotide exchange factor 12-like isoform X1 [Labeo rohita]|uniref:Rho guanine nucleotide exchange factor 12-like isoform X1 n=1 Tax=Labeo rohita TaxID=84645 RepID=A0A498MW81_LABRO|nr:rho guanine nucleotide exchange factor 12-like isoform X1 [Labeo rohita]
MSSKSTSCQADGQITSSILSRDHPPNKSPKSDKLPGTPTHEFDPTDVLVQKSGFVVADRRPESCGLVQRCVIIQKDENGFGLTVSGDNPVFVQLVKQDGAAMRAGVQTGDRIIKVNGTLVTQSNHVEVVKLIKSGSYVALTVLGRPPGLPQIPLSEVDVGLLSPGGYGDPFVTSPNSYNAVERTSSPLVSWGLKEDYSRTPTPKPLRDIQEAKKHIPHQQGHTHESLCLRNSEDGFWVDEDQYKGDLSPECFWSGSSVSSIQRRFYPASPESQRDSSCSSPKSNPRDSLNSCPSPDVEDCSDLDSRFSSTIGSPPSRLASEIIAAEDDDFDTEQEQVNGQCSCFQSIELLKTRPAHLAAFLHHVISQFDPAPLLCYLYADLYKQTNSKETRRIFMDFLTFFLDRGANLKVAVPESISYELERRRPELIPEELHRQYIQTMQETLLPDVQRNLEDFRQKRSMGLTLADVELSRLDSEQPALERERSCAENILTKIDDVLLTSQPTEEEKWFEELQSEDDQGSDVYSDVDPPNWQQLVGRDVLAGLTPHEIKRQEVINELFYTERAHVRMLKVLDSVFYQKLTRDNILPPADIKNIFTNLEEIIQLHMRIADQMTAIRKKNELTVIDHIGDELLSWFSGGEEEKIKQAVGTFCSNQPFALELIKSRQKKDQRFTSFMQEAESNRLCRRLQLKDIIPAEMQRFTKYPLLLDNIAKYTDESEEKDKVRRAAECCRHILSHVNQSVKESENKQRLEDYQRRLDLSSLKQSENPMISEFKNLDLTKRKMVHEGPLSWKINKDKTIELYTLLLEDILVLLQKQDERFILRCHSKNLAGTADTKHIFSPIIKLSTVLVRSVATDNRSFFVISMSKNGAQIYELMAQTVSEQRMWQRQIAQRAEVVNAKPHSVIPLPQHDVDRDSVELSKFSKGSERISTGSIQSAGSCACTNASLIVKVLIATILNSSPHHLSSEKDSEFSPTAALRDCVPDANPGEEDQVPRAGRDASYLDSELLNGRDADSLSCSSKAEEALKTLAALKQVLVTQLMAQDEGERLGRSAGSRLLRTTSLRTPVEHSSARTPSRAQDYTCGDTGFYECPEDYAYLVLEGYGGPCESSTDDDIQVRRKESSLAHSCAADSGISLKFSSPSSGSTSRLSRQVLSHLRCLQATLNQLKIRNRVAEVPGSCDDGGIASIRNMLRTSLSSSLLNTSIQK